MPYHFLGCYNLTEGAHDRMFVRIPVEFDALQICHGKRVEQEPLFSYMSLDFIDGYQFGLWVVSYTERVVRTCAVVLTAKYEQYKLWYLTHDRIAFAHRLGMDMAVVLGSRGNVRELLEMI